MRSMFAAPTTQTRGVTMALLLGRARSRSAPASAQDVLLGVDVLAHDGERVRVVPRSEPDLGVEVGLHVLERVPPQLGGAVVGELALDLLLLDGDVDPVA